MPNPGSDKPQGFPVQNLWLAYNLQQLDGNLVIGDQQEGDRYKLQQNLS
jgi:hypothetical protein